MPDGSVQAEDWRAGGFGVYVHWPFCAAKCPYCDFNSHVRAAVDQDRWRRALVSEIARAAAETPGRRVDTIFFGGGTPSLMLPETVAAVIDAVAAGWRVAPDAEVTLEANPTSAEAGRFRAYAAAGVTRLSMGVQALNDADLRALGRLHDVAEARRAFDLARVAFGQVSFDLIYARQGQTAAAWRAELAEALDMAVDHLSLYQLTIEPGTPFAARAARGGLAGLPDAALSAELYEATQAACDAAGLAAYEISNHARPGREGRHNLVYWRYGDYAGVGPGAHGRLSIGGERFAIETASRPEDWLRAVETLGSGETTRTAIAPPEQATELMLTGLRLREGVSLRRYAALAGAPPPQERLDALSEMGLIVVEERDRLRTTKSGAPVLDAILRDILNQ